MICQTCQGLHYVRWRDDKRVWHVEPCPDCGGHGIVHCCEGLRSQPEFERLCTCVAPLTGDNTDTPCLRCGGKVERSAVSQA